MTAAYRIRWPGCAKKAAKTAMKAKKAALFLGGFKRARQAPRKPPVRKLAASRWRRAGDVTVPRSRRAAVRVPRALFGYWRF